MSQILENLEKREKNRQIELSRKKIEKENIQATNEKYQFIENIFNEKITEISTLISHSDNLDKKKLPTHFDNISTEINSLKKFISDSSIFLRNYDLRIFNTKIHELETKIKECEEILIPKKKFGFKNKTKTKSTEKITKTQPLNENYSANSENEISKLNSANQLSKNEILGSLGSKTDILGSISPKKEILSSENGKSCPIFDILDKNIVGSSQNEVRVPFLEKNSNENFEILDYKDKDEIYSKLNIGAKNGSLLDKNGTEIDEPDFTSKLFQNEPGVTEIDLKSSKIELADSKTIQIEAEVPKIDCKEEKVVIRPHLTYFDLEFNGYRDISNKILTLNSAELKNKDVSLHNLKGCIVKLNGNPNTLHISNLDQCTILSGPVTTSIFAENCQNCHFIVSCQQLRFHKSRNCHLYLHITSKTIIEDCFDIFIAPYNYRYDQLESDFENCGFDPSVNNWDQVDDFNWLALSKKSPNWNILDPDQRIQNWNEFFEKNYKDVD